MSIICLRSGMMNAAPMTAPAMHASVTSQNRADPGSSEYPSSSSTGTVKITPALVVFTLEAMVWPMLHSRIEPRRSKPRNTPNPSTAAMALPTMVKPILSPE